MANDHANIISSELNLLRKHVSATLRMLDEGATIPFISRYRKEKTGGMNEVMVHTVAQRHKALTELDNRKELILTTIKEQNALTPALEQRILETLDPIVLEDIYLPFKPKRQTRAQVARKLGLEPLAKMIMSQTVDDLDRAAAKFVNSEVADTAAAVDGASDIIAEWINESEKARNIVRSRYQRSATISATVIPGKEEEGKNYSNYFDYSEPLRLCNSHRYLAIRRGEEEGILKVNISIDDDEMIERLSRMFVKPGAPAASVETVRKSVKDSYRRLMKPSIDNEVSAAVKERSDDAAIQMFADNVRQLLMASPLCNKRVLAIDPGFRTGCKLVVLDQQGNLLNHDVIYPTPPANDFVRSADAIFYYIDQYRIDAIAIGNGTAGRETERLVRGLGLDPKVQIFSVSEDGASVYSASATAREEFPDQDVTVRGAVSIGRRLMDPLAELVKIDPKSIGVGQYQHDVNQTKLRSRLDSVVESCVNAVGVNLNTASRHLLTYVSGLGPTLAQNIVDYREANGPFASRAQLKKVPRLGPVAFQQCAGFLRIPGAKNPLDNSAVHPESYHIVERMARDCGCSVAELVADRSRRASIKPERYVDSSVGLPTLRDILSELEKPGRDPRCRIEEFAFDERVDSIDSLAVGMELPGIVTNITNFGAFVDIGVHHDGLVHISQLADHYVADPMQAVRLHQHVRVKVIEVDRRRGRISLSMRGLGN